MIDPLNPGLEPTRDQATSSGLYRDPSYLNAIFIDDVKDIQNTQANQLGPRMRRMRAMRHECYPSTDVVTMSMIFWYHVMDL